MNTPWRRIERRSRSHTAVQAVESSTKRILWDLNDSVGCRKVYDHKTQSDFEGWVAHVLLATYADCRVEVEGR